jgi:polyphosphate kinase 2 (PPK2 family)
LAESLEELLEAVNRAAHRRSTIRRWVPGPKKPGKKIDKAVYEAELFRLQTELVKLQEWVRAAVRASW